MALAAVAHALDRLRAPTLSLASRSRWLRAALRSRTSRVELFAALGVSSALLAALVAPALLWLWAPLVLGVPHLAADVRYLALPSNSPVAVRVRDVAVAALLAATLLWPSPRLGGAAVVVAWLLSPWSAGAVRQAMVGAVIVSAYAAMWRWPIESSYVLLHAHNAIAVLMFAGVFGRGRARWWLPAALAALSALLLLGALDPVLPSRGLDEIAGYVLPLRALEQWPASFSTRLAVLFVFMQSVHYAIWLRLVPELARPRAGARSFRASLVALQREFSAVGVALLAALALLVLGLAAHDPLLAQREYLRFAGFHAYLELAFLARWLAR